jgi:hypothetical protein
VIEDLTGYQQSPGVCKPMKAGLQRRTYGTVESLRKKQCVIAHCVFRDRQCSVLDPKADIVRSPFKHRRAILANEPLDLQPSLVRIESKAAKIYLGIAGAPTHILEAVNDNVWSISRKYREFRLLSGYRDLRGGCRRQIPPRGVAGN